MTALEVLTPDSDIKPIQSLWPPETLFGYTAHSLLVPPFPMQSVLILGYGDGTVDFLMRKVWDIPGFVMQVTGVDVRDPAHKHNETIFKKMTANQFVSSCIDAYDYVVIDIYDGDKIPEFVKDRQFANKVAGVTRKMFAINCSFDDYANFESYDERFILDCVKQVNHDKVLFFVKRKDKGDAV